MSTLSASRNMSQSNQPCNSHESVTPMKRKRGRPRKDEIFVSEPNKINGVLQSPHSADNLVGQEVSCSFIGVFDAGYLLSVRVGSSGTIFKGLVFDPHLSIPVTEDNDIAPHLPMLRRNGFSSPVEDDAINHGDISSQPGIASKIKQIQNVQANKSPTLSSFASHMQTDLQLNSLETMPDQGNHIPHTSKAFVEEMAIETSEQSTHLSLSYPQSQFKSEHTPNSVRLSDISLDTFGSKPSNGYNPLVLSMVTSSEVSKPFNVSDRSDTSKTLDNSKETSTLVLKTSKASAIDGKNALDEYKFSASCCADFEDAQVLQHKSLKAGEITVECFSSEKLSQRPEEPSDGPNSESLGDSRRAE